MTEDIRALQEPLKQQYRADPASALVTLHADGDLGASVSCSVQTGQALVRAGLHPATGGDGSLACSGDMLLQALAACAGVTLRAVAAALGLTVAGTVHAEGDLDFRGTLAVDRDAPVGFQRIRLRFELDDRRPPRRSSTRCCAYRAVLRGVPDPRHAACPVRHTHRARPRGRGRLIRAVYTRTRTTHHDCPRSSGDRAMVS